MVFGWAYVAKRGDGTQVEDHSGDVIDTPEAVSKMEDAFYAYARDSREADMMHEAFGVGQLVEQVVFTPDKFTKMGLPEGIPTGAWVGYYLPPDDGGPSDQAWEKARSGELTAFSIVGHGGREAVA